MNQRQNKKAVPSGAVFVYHNIDHNRGVIQMGYYDNTEVGKQNKKAIKLEKKSVKYSKQKESNNESNSYHPSNDSIVLLLIVLYILMIGAMTIGVVSPVFWLVDGIVSTLQDIHDKLLPFMLKMVLLIGIIGACIIGVVIVDKRLQKKYINQ